jgi:hypothetical protein
MLSEEFPKPLRTSSHRLAKEIGVPAQRIGEIVAGRRARRDRSDRRHALTSAWSLLRRTAESCASVTPGVQPPAAPASISTTTGA